MMKKDVSPNKILSIAATKNSNMYTHMPIRVYSTDHYSHNSIYKRYVLTQYY